MGRELMNPFRLWGLPAPIFITVLTAAFTRLITLGWIDSHLPFLGLLGIALLHWSIIKEYRSFSVFFECIVCNRGQLRRFRSARGRVLNF